MWRGGRWGHMNQSHAATATADQVLMRLGSRGPANPITTSATITTVSVIKYVHTRIYLPNTT